MRGLTIILRPGFSVILDSHPLALHVYNLHVVPPTPENYWKKFVY